MVRIAGHLSAVVALAGAISSAPAQTPHVESVHVLPHIPIAALQNAALPGTIENDRRLSLGGFSDLWRASGDPPGRFWIVTDRGPNGTVAVAGKKHRTFPTPTYTPSLVRLSQDGAQLKVLETIPLVGHSGKPVTGLPNSEADGAPLDFLGQQQLQCNPSGLDVEAMVRAPDGTFWLAEEYRPSILKVDRAGKVLRRLVPTGTQLDGADYEVLEVLPGVYARRRDNRGFEGLAISPDGTTIYAALQSPLANPTEKSGKQSRNVRILALDIATERPTAEYLYPFEQAENFAPGVKPDDLKIGALSMVSATRMLVLERDDRVAKIFAVDLSGASSILNTPPATATDQSALELIQDYTTAGIKPLTKQLVADLTQLPALPGKLEGMCVVDPQTLAVVNDNDFGFDGFDAAGNAIPSGVRTKLVILRLDGQRDKETKRQ